MLAKICKSRNKLFHRWCDEKSAMMTGRLAKARDHISHSGFIFIRGLFNDTFSSSDYSELSFISSSGEEKQQDNYKNA
jgi:hypothetical protein